MDPQKAMKQLKELEKLGSTMRLAAEAWDAEWKTLIATIMSAQNRDESTIVAAQKLFARYNTLSELASVPIADVEEIIKSINLYKTKAKNVVLCAKHIVTEHNGQIPHDLIKLIELPGVGRKTANVFLSEYGHDSIGVDTHLSYISQRLGWTKHKMPDDIEHDLTKLFPKKHWSSVNPIAVRFGKTYTSRKEKDEILKEIQKIK